MGGPSNGCNRIGLIAARGRNQQRPNDSRFPIPCYLSAIEYAGSFFGTRTFFSVT